jgi:hypothetical protein
MYNTTHGSAVGTYLVERESLDVDVVAAAFGASIGDHDRDRPLSWVLVATTLREGSHILVSCIDSWSLMPSLPELKSDIGADISVSASTGTRLSAPSITRGIY